MIERKTADLEIRSLGPADVDALTGFFHALVESGMNKTFHPHPFDAATAQTICCEPRKDWYAAAFVSDAGATEMAGYVMLRGWDAGYEIPAFGVCVLPQFQRLGFGRLLLQHALLVARLRGAPSVRLKVYPDNTRAVAMYHAQGFTYQPALEQDQLVGYYHFAKSERAGR